MPIHLTERDPRVPADRLVAELVPPPRFADVSFESYRPEDRGWRRLQPVPDPRGGTGAAALAGQVVSVGGEEPGGTIAEVLAYRIEERRWVQLQDLPTPRHGVGVAAFGGQVFVIGGGPAPGLTVSSANETLRVSH